MALQYKLEFVYDDKSSADASVFIQLRSDPPVYHSRITKEDYVTLDVEDQDDFLTGIFNVDGVVELSSKAFRIWIMKSPTYAWNEVLSPLLDFLMTEFSETEILALPGSGNMDGTGFSLSKITQRRRV